MSWKFQSLPKIFARAIEIHKEKLGSDAFFEMISLKY